MYTLLPPPDQVRTTSSGPPAPGDGETLSSPPRESRGFRADIEGLRAVAVLLVLAFHAHVPGLGGGFVGVDVFFVISGFLITSQLVREVQATGTIRVGAFYARRARRILPPAAIVLVVTGLTGALLLPELAVYRMVRELLAALLYVANWEFIGQGKDYLGGSTDDSPVLHMWSLAVEEQFYLVWPTLVLAAAWVARRRGRSPVAAVAGTLAVVSLVSLGSAVWQTQSDPVLAYMATWTRAWQFGAGAAVAFVVPLGERLPAVARVLGGQLAGAAGLVLVVSAAVLVDTDTPYPGVAALAPTLGAGLLIVAGPRAGTSRLLSLRPMRAVGRWSYAWYLWHWPALVLVGAVVPGLSWPQRVLVTLASGVLAALTHRLVERPIARSHTMRRRLSSALAVGVLTSAVGVGSALSVGAVAVSSLGSTGSYADATTFAKVFGTTTRATGGSVSPNPLVAASDLPHRNCIVDRGSAQPTCVFGQVGGTPVFLFGDSHAHQWQPAFETLAEEHGWQLTVAAKAGCPVADIAARAGSQDRFSQADCRTWRREQIERITALRPSIVFVSGFNHYIPQTDEMVEAWRSSLERLARSGAKIVYIRDTPTPPHGDDVPECVSGALDDWSACSFTPMQAPDPVYELATRATSLDISLVDLNGYLCPGGGSTCPAVINGTLLYRDDSHISATAASLLAPGLERGLAGAGVVAR